MIEKLKGDKEMRDSVLVWMMNKGFDKQYKKCSVKLSKDCVGVGKVDTFHGKCCPECRKEKKNTVYSKKENH